MTSIRTLAFFAFACTVPLLSGAQSIPASASSPSLAAGADFQQPPGFEAGDIAQDSASTSPFASGAVPVGDSRLALRPFSLSGDVIQESSPAGVVEEPPSPTPEPAGLFLLGTGAFATALSIRYRLFSL